MAGWRPHDWLQEPHQRSTAALDRRLQDAALRAELQKVRLPTTQDLLARFNASEQELRRIVGEGPIITDDRPYIEFFRSLPKNHPPNMSLYSRDQRQVIR